MLKINDRIKTNKLEIGCTLKTTGSGEVDFAIMAPILYGSFKADRVYEVVAVEDEVVLHEIEDGVFERITIKRQELERLLNAGELMIC